MVAPLRSHSRSANGSTVESRVRWANAFPPMPALFASNHADSLAPSRVYSSGYSSYDAALRLRGVCPPYGDAVIRAPCSYHPYYYPYDSYHPNLATPHSYGPHILPAWSLNRQASFAQGALPAHSVSYDALRVHTPHPGHLTPPTTHESTRPAFAVVSCASNAVAGLQIVRPPAPSPSALSQHVVHEGLSIICPSAPVPPYVLTSPPVKMLGVLDAVGSDLLKATWAQKWRWKIAGDDNEWPDQAAVKWSYQANCSLAGNWTTHRCRNFGENVEGIDMWYSNTKGAQDFNATYFRDMNTTIYNYFTVMRDALHLDLGNIDKENNVFLSQEAFKARVLPDPFMNLTAPYVIGRRRPRPFNGTYTYDQFWRTCTWGWGCHNGTWTEAILNNASSAVNITNGLPIHALADQHSVVIDVKYVCPAFKVKQTGPLLVSVFIGTFSMYTALYGIFLFVAPRLDERYRKKHGLGRYSDDEEDYGRQYRFMYELYKSPPHSANPYYTVFDPYEQRRTSTESVPRYDPGHYPSYGRSLRKRAGSLPSGGGYFPAPAAQPDEPLLPTGNFHPISASRSRDSTSSAVPHGHGPPMLRTDSTLPGYFDPYLVTPGPPPSGARGPR